jgi:hypothetical protein
MGQAVAVVIPLGDDKDLGLVFQAAESRGVDDSIPVALEGSA